MEDLIRLNGASPAWSPPEVIVETLPGAEIVDENDPVANRRKLARMRRQKRYLEGE